MKVSTILFCIAMLSLVALAEGNAYYQRILHCIEFCNKSNLSDAELAEMDSNSFLRDTRTEVYPKCVVFASFRCVCVDE